MTTPAFVARQAILAGAGLFLLAMGAGAASAQSPGPDPRWETWVGCWQPTVAPGAVDSVATPPVTCVVPAGDASVEVVTVVDGEIANRETVRAGERRSIEREGCAGWETVTGSSDGRRAYRTSEFTCEGDLQRRATGLMTMAQGQWLDVTGVSAGGYTDVQVVRYRPAGVPEALDAAAKSALEGRGLAVEAARLAAAAPVTADGVVEAVRLLDAEVVEAWLVERGQGFAMDAPQLVQLADAGVPERVIDLMVALSYPDVFAVSAEAREGRVRSSSDPGRTVRPRPVYGWGYPGYGRGNYYPGYGDGGYGGYYGGYPVIIEEKEPEEAPRGRAVKGRGYTRGGSSDATPSSRRPSDSRTGSDSGSRDSAGSSDSGTSSGSTRTAKPRGGG